MGGKLLWQPYQAPDNNMIHYRWSVFCTKHFIYSHFSMWNFENWNFSENAKNSSIEWFWMKKVMGEPYNMWFLWFYIIVQSIWVRRGWFNIWSCSNILCDPTADKAKSRVHIKASHPNHSSLGTNVSPFLECVVSIWALPVCVCGGGSKAIWAMPI